MNTHILAVALLGAHLSAQAAWQQLTPAVQPPQIGVSLDWDAATGTLLWCGWDNSPNPNLQVWSFDGAAWSQLPSANPPAWDAGARAVWDPARQRLVLFRSGETWEWDRVQWTQRAPATSPSPRANVAMAHDAARGEVVLFGGDIWSSALSNSIYHDETWAWDGTDWQLRAVGGPPPRSWSAMAYDSHRAVLVLFGGWSTFFWSGGVFVTVYSDTWEWDGSAWKEVKGAGGTRTKAHAMAYDAGRRRVVLFGGSGDGYWLDWTWEYDGQRWDLRHTGSPSGRNDARMAYDPARGRMVMTGGYHIPATDTWEYFTPNPAGFSTFGAGCDGTGSSGGPFSPHLLVPGGQLPWLGDTWTIDAVRIPLATSAAMLIGASNSQWTGGSLPLSLSILGAPGCDLLVSPELAVPMTVSQGRARADIAVPNLPSLVGAPVYGQAVVFSPGANVLGAIVSEGAIGVVGAR